MIRPSSPPIGILRGRRTAYMRMRYRALRRVTWGPLGWIPRMLRSRKRMGYCGATRAAGTAPTSSEKVSTEK